MDISLPRRTGFFAVLVLLAALSSWADVVVDNDYGAPGYVDSGDWILSSWTGYNGGTYVFTSNDGVLRYAIWTPNLPAAGSYEVYVVFRRGSNRTPAAPYTIHHAGGTTMVSVDMTGSSDMAEVLLGEFSFDAGTGGWVRLENNGGQGAYIADAVIFRSGVDDPPVIHNTWRAPLYPGDSQGVQVTAQISDDGAVSSATLDYSVTPSSASGSVTMYDDGAHGDGGAGDGIWGGAIPGFAAGQTVSYSVTARDNGDQTTAGSPEAYLVGDTGPGEYRVLWIDSWNTGFLNASQCLELINTCRANNINTIMPEVRKVGDAYYASNLEPRASNISGGSTFDPLGYLIEQAHDTSGGKNRIEVHAWFVMQRIATSTSLPTGHVLARHPEYTMLDSTGNQYAGTTRYLDPGHPGAVNHNIAVILDCMSNYDVDGVNLDYIRYPEYSGEWGYNPVSVSRFNDYYGKAGQPSGSDPDWDAWRRECVTLEVKKLYVEMAKLDPSVVLTADTVNWGYTYDNWTASSAYAAVFQDWVGWLEEGILDYNALMDYSTSMSRFQGWANLSMAHDNKRGSIIGVGAYLQTDIQDSMDQLLWTRSRGAGLNIYDWGSEVNAAPQTRTQFYQALKAQVYADWAYPPAPEWKTNPTAGILEGTVTADGAVIDHAAVSIDGLAGVATVSDGSGWYGLIDVPPGGYTVRYSKPSYPEKTRSVQITAGGILTEDVDLLAAEGRSTIEVY